jgi:hypothetical protein
MRYLLLAFGIFLSPLAYAEMDRKGNGGDYLTLFPETLWFDKRSGKSTVTACVEASPGFAPNLNSSIISEIIKDSYHQWVRYLSEKGELIVRFRIDETYEDSKREKYSDVLVPQINVSPRCSGGEDLAIYLGGTNRRVQKYKSRYQDPIAFAELESFDFKTRWGKGIVWVTDQASLFPGKNFPNWDKDAFKAAMLHELGHVFGQKHIDQTIMTEDLVGLLFHKGHWGARSLVTFENDLDLVHYYFNNIDHQKSVVSCLECQEEKVEGEVSPYYFEMLTGRESKGAIRAALMRNKQGAREFDFTLKISDSGGEFNFEVHVDPAPQNIVKGGDLTILSGSLVGQGDVPYAARILFNTPSDSAGYAELGKIYSGIELQILRYQESLKFHRYEHVFTSTRSYRKN